MKPASVPQHVDQGSVKKSRSPSRGKRMLQSAACIAGASPKRIPLEDDDEDELQHSESRKSRTVVKDNNVVTSSAFPKLEPVLEDDGDSHESPPLAPPPAITRAWHDETPATSLRQRQLDEAIHGIISNDSVPTREFDETSPPVMKMQPTYDDAHMVFRSPSSDAGTDVSRGARQEAISKAKTEKSNCKPSPAKPVVLEDGEALLEPTESSPRFLAASKSSGSSSLPTGDSYGNVESLIARVRRLDAVVQAGEEEQAARSHVEESARSPVEEAVRSVFEESAEMKQSDSIMTTDTNDSPVIKPIASPCHDSPTRAEKSGGVEAKEDIDDASRHFQVIYRRGRDSPVNSQVKTSVATSSIVTMSSFGISEVPVMQRAVPVVTPTSQKTRDATQLKAHPFFWRTHPKEIFTSYTPNRPKTMLAPLQNGYKKDIVNLPSSYTRKGFPPNSSISSRSLRMRTVEEVGEQKYDTRYRATSHERPWSGDRDLRGEGTAGFSPYGDESGSTRRPVTAPLSPTDRPSSSDSWVAFSEFSVGSAAEFGEFIS